MFRNRKDAGKKLARALEKYRDEKALVLAIPRGGVEVGFEVAEYLKADFSMLISRKLPYPNDPEAGFGAVAEDGSIFVFSDNLYGLSGETINQILCEQKNEIIRRINVLRGGKPLPDIKDRIIILVDDGIAGGSTMRASIMLCRNRKAKKIVVASPVSSREVAEELKELSDDVVILEKPPFFRAVAQVYENWYDVSDEEVKRFVK
jgi:predicted phosphoribosyltransferase